MAFFTSRKRQAFTLIELLVTIFLIALIIALLMVGVQKARDAAARTACINNLREIGLAFHHYHLSRNSFPTEGNFYGNATGIALEGNVAANDSSDPYPSFYTSLLPYMEQQNATPSTPIKSYLCPGRRDVNVGAKRDYGYASSRADSAVGPSILDSQVPVSLRDITNGGNGATQTAMLTHVWMLPSTYQSGDATDVGWSQKYNSRTHTKSVHPDSDLRADNTYLGGPHGSDQPTLYADGHIENLSWVNTTQYAQSWAYTPGTIGNSCAAVYQALQNGSSYVPTANCSNCGTSCKCGCASNNSAQEQQNQLTSLDNKWQNGQYLSSDESNELYNLSPSEWQQYANQWVPYMAKNDIPLTPNEQNWYNNYQTQQTISQLDKKWESGQYLTNSESDQLKQLSPNDWNQYAQNEIPNKAKSGQPLTQNEQTWYNNYQQQQQIKQEVQQLDQKWQSGGSLTAQQSDQLKQLSPSDWNKYAAQDIPNKAKSGQPLTQNEQNWYNNYQNQQTVKQLDQTWKSGGQLTSQQSDQLYQLNRSDWNQYASQTVPQKAQSGQPLTQNEQKWYQNYQSQQQAQQQASTTKNNTNYANNVPSGSSSTSGSTPSSPSGSSGGSACSCGFSCCANGGCKCK